MLYTRLLKDHFNTVIYPNLEPRADGAPIPLGYGDIHGAIPVCIDTALFKYKHFDHAMHALDAVRNGDETLVLGSDYTVDLALAEFTLCSTPYLAANTTYYFIIEADYPISGVNHISFKKCATAGYAGGQAFTIDGAGIWTPVPTVDLLFRVYGRASLSAQDVRQVDTSPYLRGSGFALRDAAAQTRIAQSFTTGASPFFLTSLQFWTTKKGSPPASTLRATIVSAYNPAEIRVGAQSLITAINTELTWWSFKAFFPLQSDVSDLVCDLEAAEKAGATIVDGADMVEHLVVTRLGKSALILDAAALANFKAKRTHAIAAYIDSADATFGDVVGKLESSLLFKFAPLHDGTYAPTVYEAGEPAGTPHLRDEHFLSFSMRRNFSAVKNIVKVKYDENPENSEFKVEDAESHVARFVYGTEETLEVETYHKTQAGAAWLAGELSGMYETPPLEIKFEVRGYGLNLIPGRDKVKVSRARAAYAGGTITGVLFRIVKLTKKPATASTEIIAVLDTQTY
jgi:hypothetical protein